MRPACLLVTLFVGLLGSAQAQSSVSDFVDGDPIAFLASLAGMPDGEQADFLSMVGTMLQQSSDLDCNIFGGEDACKAVSGDSPMHETCKGFSAARGDGSGAGSDRVDCAYYSSTQRDLDSKPEDALVQGLGPQKAGQLANLCPQCLHNIQSLWCAQAMPECGSFQQHVQGALFPAALALTKMQDQGQPLAVAVAAAVPGVVAAMSKTMACREMCTAVMRTCSCAEEGKEKSVGEIMTAYQSEMMNAAYSAEYSDYSSQDVFDQGFDPAVASIMFGDMWDKPLCDLFTPSSDPDFVGTCDPGALASTCTHPNTFCAGLSDSDADLLEAVIVMQIAQGVAGFVQGPLGLAQQDEALGETAKALLAGVPPAGPNSKTAFEPDEDTPVTAQPSAAHEEVSEYLDTVADSWQGQRNAALQPRHKASGTGALSVFLALMFLAVTGFGAAVGYKRYQVYKGAQEDGTDSGDYELLEDDVQAPAVTST